MRFLLVVTMIVALLAAGCGKKADQEAQVTPQMTEDEVICQKASAELISRFSKDLKTALLSAMSEGGPTNAISVCKTKAPEVAAAYSASEFVTIKRVTDKNRNPENLADSAQMEVLATFANLADSSTLVHGRFADVEGGQVYTYYQGIKTGQLCLKCHGGPDKIDKGVQAFLTKEYPEDKAVGYNDGDLRGMFVVEITWPQGKEFAQSLIADSL